MGFLPIIIPHQPSCFVLFCVVGWVVATKETIDFLKSYLLKILLMLLLLVMILNLSKHAKRKW